MTTTTTTNNNNNNNNPNAICLTSLGETLLAVILSYNSAPDLVHVLDSQSPILIKAVQLALSNAASLHFSYLLQLDRCRNHGSGKKLKSHNHQEEAIRILFDAILDEDDNENNNDHDNHTTSSNSSRAKLERVELTGLRHIVGDQGKWLSRIFDSDTLTRLTSVDFSGCAMLDPKLVHAALTPATDANTKNNNNSSTPPTSSIRHLNFHGCYRIDAEVVMALISSRRFQNLQSLGLGGCSQSIADECVHYIISHFRKLQCLDLSGLKRITENIASEFLFLSDSLQSLELAGCELLRFITLRGWCRNFFSQGLQLQSRGSNDNSLADLSRLTSNSWHENQHVMDQYPPDAKKPFQQLMIINFNGIGTPRRGLVEGALPYFALRSMGALREVYLSGCEQIQDWEVEVLARVCANSLTCLEMRACCVGDRAVRSVGIHCTNISDVDFSACFQITDEGILSFCQHKGIHRDVKSTVSTSNISPMKSLKIGALPQLTNRSIQAIASLTSLILLDINNCPKVTPDALSETVKELTSLVELDAKGIGKWTSSVAALYSYDNNRQRLRFVNGRPFPQSSKIATKEKVVSTRNCFTQCIVRQHSKRLNHTQGVPLQTMYHCLDCMLIPSLNRGICHACCHHCHSSHQTFVGSFSRFFCDCPFGIAGNVCQAISCGQTEGTKEVATNQWTI